VNVSTVITAPFVRLPRWIWGVFLATLRRCMGNGVTATASQFAFNAFLATIPFLFVVVTAIRIAGPDAYSTLFSKLEATIPGISGLADAFNRTVASGAAAGFVIIAAALIALYMTSNAIGALVDGLDRAQRLPHRRWIRAKGINMILTAGTVLLAVASVLALAGGEKLAVGITEWIGTSQSTSDLVDSLTMPAGLATIFVFLVLLYRFGPNQMRLGFRAIIPGALLSTAAWWLSTSLISLYAQAIHNFRGVYGTLGTIFVYMNFLYFSGLMFLVGGELNAELLHRRQVRAARAQAARKLAEQEAAREREATKEPEVTVAAPTPLRSVPALPPDDDDATTIVDPPSSDTTPPGPRTGRRHRDGTEPTREIDWP